MGAGDILLDLKVRGKRAVCTRGCADRSAQDSAILHLNSQDQLDVLAYLVHSRTQHLPVAILYDTPMQAREAGAAEHRFIHAVRSGVISCVMSLPGILCRHRSVVVNVRPLGAV